MRVIADLTEGQYDAALEAWRKHTHHCGWAGGQRYAGAIGGVQSWHITATSIGPIINLCCACGWKHLANGDDL